MAVVFIIITVTCRTRIFEGKSEASVTRRPRVGQLKEHRSAFLSPVGVRGEQPTVALMCLEIQGPRLLLPCLTTLQAPGWHDQSSIAGISVL